MPDVHVIQDSSEGRVIGVFDEEAPARAAMRCILTTVSLVTVPRIPATAGGVWAPATVDAAERAAIDASSWRPAAVT